MNKNCNSNVDTVVSQANRLLDNLYALSNTMEDFRSINLDFIDLGFVKWNNEGSIDKLLSLCYLLEIKSEVLLDLQRLLSSVPMICNVLNADELMCLKFINDFGVIQFIGEADEDCVDKLLSFFKVIEFKCSVLFSHYIPMQSYYHHHLNKQKHVKRRTLEVRTRTRAIQLGSAAIYSKISEDSDDSENSEKGSLVRSEGIIYKKCIEAMSKATKTPWSKSKFVAAYKFLERTRHLVRLAKVYENYTIFYHGRYLKDISKDSQSSDVSKDNEDTAVKNGKKDVYFVQILEELAGCEYRYSGKYVKVHGNDNADASPEDTVSEYPSEKGDVPMSVRRNKHSVNISPSDKMQMNTNKMLPISTCEVSLKPFVTTPNRSYGFL